MTLTADVASAVFLVASNFGKMWVSRRNLTADVVGILEEVAGSIPAQCKHLCA
jgi:hypothetical protein